MQILLVYPPFLDERPKDYDVKPLPIGLYYIAALLRERGYQVEIINWYNLKDLDLARWTFSALKPDIIGFSIFNANRWGAIDLARLAKEILPETRIVFGGVGATFLWEHLLNHFPEIDFIVRGEGEYTFLELVEKISTNYSLSDIKKIEGLAFRIDGKPHSNEVRAFIDNIDELPDPAKFFSFQHVISSRGCPWNCIFCGSPSFWKRKVRFHSPEYFVRQLERLYRKGIKFFYFSDDTFTLKKERVIKICQEILRNNLKITWQAISRVDCIDEEIVYWMRKSGCLQISFGVESGSEKIRNKILKKKISLEQIKRAFNICRRYGVVPRAYFIYGCPGESKKTIKATTNLIKEIKPLSLVCYILDIYPGTTLYEEFKRKTGKGDDIWLERIEDILYYQTDPSLSEEKIRRFGKQIHDTFDKFFPKFIETLNLIDKKELYPFHADFLTRLGMTIQYGELSERPGIPKKEILAERLFHRALQYYPDQHAFLGLGIIYQKRMNFKDSIKILKEGLKYFPQSEELNICQAVNYMHLKEFKKALKHLLPFDKSPEAMLRAAACYEALGDFKKRDEYLIYAKSLQKKINPNDIISNNSV